MDRESFNPEEKAEQTEKNNELLMPARLTEIIADITAKSPAEEQLAWMHRAEDLYAEGLARLFRDIALSGKKAEVLSLEPYVLEMLINGIAGVISMEIIEGQQKQNLEASTMLGSADATAKRALKTSENKDNN